MWMWESELTSSANFSSEIKRLLSWPTEMRTEMGWKFAEWGLRLWEGQLSSCSLLAPGGSSAISHSAPSSTRRSQPMVNTIHTSLWNGNTKPLCLMFTGVFLLLSNSSRSSPRSLPSFHFTISLAICLQDLNQTLILLLFWTTSLLL